MRRNISTTVGVIIILQINFSCEPKIQYVPKQSVQRNDLQKLEYNNPGLLVALNVGFKSLPMAIDFDGDGN